MAPLPTQEQSTSLLTPYDLHLFNEGKHTRLFDKLGAHAGERNGQRGTHFAVWAPNAERVSVVGDFNDWNADLHPMKAHENSGVWEAFVPSLGRGAAYKYHIRSRYHMYRVNKADPFAFYNEMPPRTASIIWDTWYEWSDQDWMRARHEHNQSDKPMSIYEVHLGSWMRVPEERNRSLTYRELAVKLADYVSEMGFTHVEFMPVMEHPFFGSWGYQVTSYYAPSARFGKPQDFMYLVDQLHQRGIGVILDWVPAHFPRDEWALAHFDGTPLYEPADPRRAGHPDWGTLIFDYGRPEVRNFLVANAIYWLEEFHADGLRVDAVASMLYLDYSRAEGEWVPNALGGRENLDAVSFLREANATCYKRVPGIMMIAEESTAWPGVTRPVQVGGLGFGLKWNLGWMHDTLSYLSTDPVFRHYHQNEITFSMVYAFSENFVLPLSHDEVVHGKGSLLQKMPGDEWKRFAGLRALLAYQWAHPGKQLLFMGSEFGQEHEWSEQAGLDWQALGDGSGFHGGVQRLVRDLNQVYSDSPALWRHDFSPDGFSWIDASDSGGNVLAFLRFAGPGETGPGAKTVACLVNFSGGPHHNYRIGLPATGRWREVLNTDAASYGGSGVGNLGAVEAVGEPWHGQPASAVFSLPPLGVLLLAPES